MPRPAARGNPAMSAVASPKRLVRLMTTRFSPRASSRCRLAAISGFGPSSTMMNSYGISREARPALYSVYSAAMSTAWRLPTGMITDSAMREGSSGAESPAVPMAFVIAGSSLDDEGPHADLLREAREFMLAHVAELVDELADRAAPHEDDRTAEEDHPASGDRQR